MEITDPTAFAAEQRTRLDDARVFLDLEGKAEELEGLREKASEPDLWDDPNEARIISQRLARYESLFDKVDGLASQIEDAEVLLELAAEADDAESRAEAVELLRGAAGSLGELELESLF
ncbi:MAG: PCRF domain-containing protein, partial [Acidimicrobiia bacterium]